MEDIINRKLDLLIAILLPTVSLSDESFRRHVTTLTQIIDDERDLKNV